MGFIQFTEMEILQTASKDAIYVGCRAHELVTRAFRSMLDEKHVAGGHEYRIHGNVRWEKRLKLIAVVDNKPVFDHVHNTHNHNIRDKRHALEMLIAKDEVNTRGIILRWVATTQMIGDILTKKGVSSELLTKVLGWCRFVLIEDEPLHSESKRNRFRGV